MFKIIFKRNKQHTEFSKKIIDVIARTTILGGIGVIFVTMLFGLPEALACTVIAALGSVALTSIVFYYRKAQAENTIKLYLASYAEVMKMKKEFGETSSEILYSMENGMLNKIDSTLNQTLDEATAPIEKEMISG